MSPAAWTRRIRVRTLEEPSLYFRSFSLESRRLFLGRFETYRVTLEHPLLQPTLRPRLLSTIPEGTIQPRALAQGYRSVGKATGILEQLAILCRATLPVMAVLIGYEVFLKEKTEENPFNRGTHLVAAVTDLFKPWPVAVFEGMIG